MPDTAVDIDTQPAVPKKRKLKPGMGKGKGNAFEGTVAKKLSTSLAPLNFIRTPGSGARVGGKNFETIGKMFGEDALKIFVGDVVPVNERQEGLKFMHSVECKFYATQDPFTTLVTNTANLFKWFGEAVDDAKKIDKNPMLIFKWNHTPIFVAVDSLRLPARQTVELVRAGVKPRLSVLTYAEHKMALDIYYIEDLLSVLGFWYEKV